MSNVPPLAFRNPAIVLSADRCIFSSGWFEPVGLRTEASEDRLRSFRQLPCNLDNAFAEGDAAPFGKLLLGLVSAPSHDKILLGTIQYQAVSTTLQHWESIDIIISASPLYGELRCANPVTFFRN